MREDVTVRIGATDKQLEAQLARTQRTAREAGGRIGREFGGIDRAARAAATGVNVFGAALAAATSAAMLVRRAINIADEIGKTAKSIGITAESLQELRFAAGRAGLETGELDRSMQVFTRNLGQAIQGTGTAKRAFERLGISIVDIRDKSPDEVLRIVADRLSGVEGAADRAAIAADIFGRSGVKMVNLLADGAEGLDLAGDRAREFGLVMSNITVAAAERMNDRIDELASAIGTRFYNSLILGTGALMRFLGVLDFPELEAARRIEEVKEALTALDAAMAKGEHLRVFDGTRRGGVVTLEEMPARVAELRAELADLEAQWAGFNSAGLGGGDGEGDGAGIGDDLDSASEGADKIAKALETAAGQAASARMETNLLAKGYSDTEAEIARTLFTLGLMNEELIFSAGLTEAQIAEIREMASAMLTLGEAREEQKAIAEAATQAERDYITSLAEARSVLENVRTPQEAYADEVERLTALLPVLIELTGSQADAQEMLNRAIEQAGDRLAESTKKTKDVNDAARDLGMTFSSAFEDAIVGGNNLRDVLQGLLQDVNRIFLRQQVTGPLSDTLSTLFSGMNFGIFHGGAPSGLGAGINRGFASGGIPPVGVPSMVGERGPELFVPQMPGRILSAPETQRAMRGGGGGNSYFIDARGADAGAVVRIEQALVRLAGPGVVERRAVTAVQNERRRKPGAF